MDVELPEKSPNGWTVVAASGEIDVASAATLRDRLIELINGKSNHLILDLDGVDFIDSTGLGVLVGAVRRARADDGDMRLVCSNARLLKVFSVTGLDEVFVIADSADEAAAEAGSGSD